MQDDHTVTVTTDEVIDDFEQVHRDCPLLPGNKFKGQILHEDDKGNWYTIFKQSTVCNPNGGEPVGSPLEAIGPAVSEGLGGKLP